MRKLYQEVRKKARAQNVILKIELHGLLKAQGSVIYIIVKKSARSKEGILAILSSHTALPLREYILCCLN